MLRAVLVVFMIAIAGVASADDKCVPTRHIDIPAIAEVVYPVAREALLKAGWQPAINYDKRRSGEYEVAEKWAANAGYYEVESCAGTGVAPCRFNFTDVYGSHLAVITEGEVIDGSQAYVRSFFFVCD